MENTKINTSGVNSPKYAIHIVDHSNQPENVIGKYTIDNSKKSHIIELSDFGDSKLNHINAILALIEFANDFGKVNPKLITEIEKELCRVFDMKHAFFKQKITEVQNSY